MKHLIACLTAALLLAGCQAPTKTLPAPELPPAEPLPVEAAAPYTVNPERSEIRILVFREGPMARYGHNHVIRGTVSGTVYRMPAFRESGFELTVPVTAFEVDPEAARVQEGEGFETMPSPQAQRGTRDNMLGSDGLDAERFPEIRLRSTGIVGPPWNPDITLRITLHGVTRELTVPAAVTMDEIGLVAIGKLAIRQSDYGIKPFSVMGGGLRVKDELQIRFRIVAERE